MTGVQTCALPIYTEQRGLSVTFNYPIWELTQQQVAVDASAVSQAGNFIIGALQLPVGNQLGVSESVDQVLLHVQTFIQVDRREKLYFEQKYCGRVFERFEPFSRLSAICDAKTVERRNHEETVRTMHSFTL